MPLCTAVTNFNSDPGSFGAEAEVARPVTIRNW